MDIDENIYRTNGFRILGLDITSKDRKISNRMSRIERYKNKNGFNDTEHLKGVFENSKMDFLLTVSPEPTFMEYQQANNRLRDVKLRLIDEIFWLWPKSFDSDLDEEVVEFLKENNYNKAISYWGDSSSSGTMNMTSIHNLAVLHHVRALDGFIDGKGNKKLFEDLNSALNYWSQVCDSDNFKNFVKQRVESLNNPILDEEFVDELFNNLPNDLLNINYLLINKLLSSSNVGKRKVDYVSKFIDSTQNSPFDKSIISSILSKISRKIDNLIDENKKTFEASFQSTENMDEKFSILFDHFDKVMPYLSILHNSLTDDIISNKLLNNTCNYLYNKIPGTTELVLLRLISEENFEKFIESLENLKEYTTDINLKNKIDSDLITLRPGTSDITLNFTVVDEDGYKLNDVDITLTSNSGDGKSYNKTTANGECSVPDLPTGRYSYTARKSGYVDYEGTVTLDSGINLEQITLKKENSPFSTADVNISVQDRQGNDLIANVTLINSDTGKRYEKTTSGSNTRISGVPFGKYRYEVTKSGYNKYESSINIKNKDNSLNVKLNEYSVPKKSSYNKKFFIYVSAIILASLAYYAAVNLL